jgi:hypothetical protein
MTAPSLKDDARAPSVALWVLVVATISVLMTLVHANDLLGHRGRRSLALR